MSTHGSPPRRDSTALAEQHIERLREKLLDLSNRNRLINFSHPERSRKLVRVVDELPAVLYAELVAGNAYRFKGVPDPRANQLAAKPAIDVVARKHGIDPSLELAVRERGKEAPQHVDRYIQLLHYPSEMEKRLEGMRQEHLTSLQELGVPALYGIFGFLEWYDTPTSAKPLLSPLVLLQLELERQRERGEYRHRVASSADEPEANRTLMFRVKRDTGIELPAIDTLVETADLDEFLADVAVAVAEMPRWRVRRSVTLGVLSFARQVMYEDLAASRWQSRGGRSASALVRGLLIGSEGELEGARGTADVVAMEPEPLLVTDADATQMAAVADALSGRSFVVKGPPGTGKSQTITNLIAAALARKKKVLFVAEKMAALEVVKKRLDDLGLSHACLALHSTKAKKRDVIDVLAKSRELRGSLQVPHGIQGREAELEKLRDELERYMQAMQQPIGKLGVALRDIVWREQYLRGVLDNVAHELHQLVIPGAASMERPELEEIKRRLADLEQAAARLPDGPTSHPWRFVTSWEPWRHRADTLVGIIARWVASFEQLLEPLRGRSWVPAEMTVERYAALADRLADLGYVDSRAPSAVVAQLADPALRSQLEDFCDLVERRRLHARRAAAVCMVDTWLPRRTTLRALVAALQEAGLGATTLTYGDLPDVIRVRTEQAKLLGLAVERARELALEGGLPGPWDAEAQRALVAVGLLAARPGRDVLRARTPANVVAGASEVLARARQLAQRLNEEAAEIDSKFIGWRELSAGDLRHHALVIRTTGLLARIFGSKSYRSSRAAYLTLTTGRAAPREAMASALERGAEQLENEAHFVEDPEVRALCGSHFRELSTDFTLIERVNAWALEVEASTHASHPRSRWIRDVLLGGATEWLERVADFLTAEGARVKALVDTTPSDLTEVASTASRTASALAAPHAFMAGHALDARTPLVDLADVSAALDQVADLDARIDAQVVVRSVLGAHWDAAATDLDVVTAAISASATLAEIGLPDDVTTWLLAGELPMRLGEATSLARKMHEALDVEAEGRRAAADSGVAVDLVAAATAPISAARQTLELARAAPAEALAAWLQFVTARRACDDLPALAAFGAAIDRASGRWEALPDLFEWSLLRALGGIAMSSHPQISGGAWSGGRLSQLRDRIRVLSAELADLKRRALAAQLASVVPPRGHGAGARGGWTNDALLRNEIAKKARHIPIRQLMARARDAVLALTPCLMMSPLSVAQFLEDTSFQFDLLVIDEASQLRPEDSLGALLRARQAVVVGDEQQLPPTEFFRRAATDDVDGDDAYAEDLETESVLDLALRVMGDARVLRWHYRSRHDSLIAFSNQNFYDNKLVVAPAPRRAGPGSGVLVRYVKGVYEASTNEREAMAVVEVVVEQMRTHPRRSIGVAALNQAQSDLIRDLLDERLRREETDFVDRWKDTLEAFFVKNLENVQGDERDTIIVSLTYGPDAAGRVYQRFGPINGANGHRRLNVLFSRAKHQLVVVTSLRAEDVKIGPASQRGVQVLRGYLEYAAARAAVSSATSSAAAPGRYARLERDLGSLGLDVETDVGAQTLTLDLGVKHPDARDEFLAGVEVDAGSWMGPARGRDRDGTRRAVLENLGWQVVTTWTTDWMREPGGARRRLFDAINQIAHGAGRALPPAPARVVAHPLDQLPALVAERPATPTLPELEVGVYANGRQHGRYTITADRIRVGRGQHCEVRIPEDFREVSSFHLEMTWESGLLVLADTSSQNGTYINGRRVSREVIPPGRTFSIQIGGGPVALRVLYANDAMAPAADRAPQPPANSSDTAHEAVLGLPARIVAKLDADERQFLSAIRANGAMRLADLVQQLGRSPMRVSGMVRTLRRTLHREGVSVFREERLPSGESVFVFDAVGGNAS